MQRYLVNLGWIHLQPTRESFAFFRLNSFIIVFEIKNENQLLFSYPAVPFLSFWGEEFRGDTKGCVGENSLPAFSIVSLVCLIAMAMLPKAPL